MTNDSSKNDKLEVYQSSYKEIKDTVDKQLDIKKTIDNKIIEIIKVDLALIAAIISAVNLFVGVENIFNYLAYIIGGLSFLIISIYYCIKGYSPSTYLIGTADAAIPYIEKVNNIRYHYWELMDGYGTYFRENKKLEDKKAKALKNGMWSVFASLIILTGSLIRLVSPNHPIIYDFGIVISIILFIFLLKKIQLRSQERKSAEKRLWQTVANKYNKRYGNNHMDHEDNLDDYNGNGGTFEQQYYAQEFEKVALSLEINTESEEAERAASHLRTAAEHLDPDRNNRDSQFSFSAREFEPEEGADDLRRAADQIQKVIQNYGREPYPGGGGTSRIEDLGEARNEIRRAAVYLDEVSSDE
ncbi:hypothetical protein [Natrinema gelatinilyticum]|uniref:hypothetical protein n=1 Tax=Natrinema gelatinilyticum TaxID=2961571 RepID=UPI0020C58C75|nr:hypothetical protein [Natrinema gelatinilyticum]